MRPQTIFSHSSPLQAISHPRSLWLCAVPGMHTHPRAFASAVPPAWIDPPPDICMAVPCKPVAFSLGGIVPGHPLDRRSPSLRRFLHFPDVLYPTALTPTHHTVQIISFVSSQSLQLEPELQQLGWRVTLFHSLLCPPGLDQGRAQVVFGWGADL